MKKIIAVLMVLTLMLSLCACDGSSAPKGEEKTWGNITVFVPDGWTLTEGSLIDEQDPDSLSLKDPDAGLLSYVNVLVDDEESIDANISATKEYNEGAEDATVKAGDKEWTGVTYESMSYKCGYLKTIAGDKVIAAYYCGYDTSDAALLVILESLR